MNRTAFVVGLGLLVASVMIFLATYTCGLLRFVRISPYIVYCALSAGLAGVFFLVRASIVGWISFKGSRRKVLSDLAHESLYAIRPFVQDCMQSVSSRPAVGALGLFTSAILALVVFLLVPGREEVLEPIGIVLGMSGLLYGILSYHVAIRVEKSIRDTITDFREFVGVVSDILASEILCEEKKKKKYGSGDVAGEVPEAPDLILLLWFPCYSMTKDFNSVGMAFDSQLGQIRELNCRTHLVMAKNPLELMLKFDNLYLESTKRYNKTILKELASLLSGQSPDEWRSIALKYRKEKKKVIDWTENDNSKVIDIIDYFCTMQSDIKAHWTTQLEDNEKLMQGLVQLVWTPKKAAMVFMPPDACDKDSVDAGPGQKAKEACQSKPTDSLIGKGRSYKCSGFVTEDPFMNAMIRDLISLRFKI